MWTLGKRNGENALKVVAKEYDGQVLIHFRHYFKVSGEDRWYPTKKGVALNLSEWDKFVESLVDIDAKVRRLRCKNEQVDPVPPKGIKRHLQSTSGGEDEWVCDVFVLWMCACMGRIVESCITYVVCMLWIKFAFVYISLSILSTKEQYGNEVGLAAFEWCGSGIQTFHLERVVQWCH